ncbi:alpha/beta fold hydrolase [Spirosoma fluviale]|uniref:Pimeloyl-ACP methyl ester carboxylesterase n=1 Tax=Spirosoma fluviale TaxID=1597977 RepID=A0A286FGM4_9BACT|nr:alpha/beta hydrolase [Spirosoma fluviale]SOD82236.1 Pimeloyl-ACP methyl ester carboxylesterase [Spirosoma fluviale]
MKFETEPGFFVHADAWGEPANPPVLLLHGGGQTRHSWGDTANVLANAGWYAIALDARGHGDSDWSDKAHYSIDYLANDLRKICATFDQKPALVGASMGGMTALVAEGERGTDYPNSICSAIVLVDIAPRSEHKGIERIFAFMSQNLDGFATLGEAAEAVAAYLPNRPRPSDNSRLEKNLRLRRGPHGDMRYFWHWDPNMLNIWRHSTGPDKQTSNENRLYQAAHSLTVPTLIVRGGISDVVSEKVMAEFLDAVPHVKSISVADAGHMVAGDSNHAFTNAVIDFLSGVSEVSK